MIYARQALQQHNRRVCDDAFNKFISESKELAQKAKKKRASRCDVVKKKIKFIEDQLHVESKYANDLHKELQEKIREFSNRQDEISAQVAILDAQSKDLQSEFLESQKHEETVALDQINDKLSQVSAAIDRALEAKPAETKISKLLKATVSVLLD